MKRMIKCISCLIIVTSMSAFTMAQNNAIFKGGTADGWVSKNFLQANTNSFKGGVADGWASLNFTQNTSSIFKGGVGDGWDTRNFIQSSTTIFKGGNGDGWVSKNIAQSNLVIFKGGNGDGWDSKNIIQSNLVIFKGGIGDGWASTYRPQGPLPITLLNFDARKLNNSAAFIFWSTSQEFNTAWFNIERSSDALNFVFIGRVAASGNSTTAMQYNFTDQAPLTGLNYYRLKQVDADGRTVYSPSRLVRFDDLNSENVKYYPNPTGGILFILLTSTMMNEAKVINITNSLGVVVDQIKSGVSTSNNLSVDMSRFAKGVYFIQVKTPTINSTQRIVLQ